MDKLKGVKPGTAVWCADINDQASYHMLFMAICNNTVICCLEYEGYEDQFDEQLQDMCEACSATEEDCEIGINVYPIEQVFLSNDEAWDYLNII